MSKTPPGPRELRNREMRENDRAKEEARQKADKPTTVAALKSATVEAAKKRGKPRKEKK